MLSVGTKAQTLPDHFDLVVSLGAPGTGPDTVPFIGPALDELFMKLFLKPLA